MKLYNNSLKSNFQPLIDHCQNFYNNTMYEQEQFDVFKKGLEEVDKNILELDKKEKMDELAKYFENYMGNDANSRPFATEEKSSQIIATVYLYNKEIFNQAFQGGKVNFSDYVQCFVESCTTKDNTVKLLMDAEMDKTIKSMAEMRYYRHNPPDREMY